MSGTLLYEVRRVHGDDEMAAALELRHDVFCVEQGVPEHEELDGRDHEGIHLVAVVRRRAARNLPRADGRHHSPVQPARGARLGAPATGSPRRCSRLADAETRAAGGRRLVLHAQTYAQELYEQAGYRPRGRVFREAGIEHIAMEKQL